MKPMPRTLLIAIFLSWVLVLMAILFVLSMPDAHGSDLGYRAIPTAVQQQDTFATADEAARAGLKLAVGVSKEYEVGGLVVECDGQFSLVGPVTSNSRVQVNYHAAFGETCRIAAIFHTHPGNDWDAHMQSGADISTQKRLGVPSYIMVVRTRQVACYGGAL